MKLSTNHIRLVACVAIMAAMVGIAQIKNRWAYVTAREECALEWTVAAGQKEIALPAHLTCDGDVTDKHTCTGHCICYYDHAFCQQADCGGRIGICQHGVCGCATECGNGILNPAVGEQCDDGNLQPGDGCSATCTTE